MRKLPPTPETKGEGREVPSLAPVASAPASSSPVKDDSTQRADEVTARGRADEVTARGRADEVTARGRADEVTARGRADEVTARGRADEVTARGRAGSDADAQLAARLCRRVAEGDGRAFNELVELYQHRIYAFCARMVGDSQEAEDLAQDVFLLVYRHAGEFREEASFTTWIYRIARNATLNRIRYLDRRGRTTKRSLDELGEERLASDERGAFEVIEGKQTAALVQEAIARLPEQQRAVVVLRDIEGLSYEDIMAITGLAEGTVKSRLHRARSALAARLSRVFK